MKTFRELYNYICEVRCDGKCDQFGYYTIDDNYGLHIYSSLRQVNICKHTRFDDGRPLINITFNPESRIASVYRVNQCSIVCDYDHPIDYFFEEEFSHCKFPDDVDKVVKQILSEL